MIIFREVLIRPGNTQGMFLQKLGEMVDWGYFTKRLIKLFKGQGVVGRPPFDPVLVLKVEVVAYLYK
jgi:hypothetical protein